MTNARTNRVRPATKPLTPYPPTPEAEQLQERAAEDAFWTAMAAQKGAR